MTEGKLEGVEGVKIFTPEPGETRVVIVISHGLSAHKWGAIPAPSP